MVRKDPARDTSRSPGDPRSTDRSPIRRRRSSQGSRSPDQEVDVLHLRVETPQGIFVRTLRPAVVLPDGIDRGWAAEVATRGAAAVWGLRDFVFRPALQRRGSAHRELGDTLIVAGPVAASVQVKSREVPSLDQARERRWLDKKIADGVRQSIGTIRTLERLGVVELENERGMIVPIHAREKTWIPVVVVDHPGLASYVPTVDAVVLLRRDWEFLFEQLKSTYAVVQYLARVFARPGHAELGGEARRYYELAAADVLAPPSPLDPRLGSEGQSAPLLPQAPVRTSNLVRVMIEDLAVVPLPTDGDAAGRLEALAAVDSVPVGIRDDLATALLVWLQAAGDSEEATTVWRFRRLTWLDRPYLIFGAASRFNPLVAACFQWFVRLRHQEMFELIAERPEAMTVGILITPRADGIRPWDTSMVATRGDQRLSPALRAAVERLWGTHEEPGQRPGDDLSAILQAIEDALDSEGP